MSSAASIEVRVQSVRWEAEGIISLELVRADGAELPAFEAGAHIDIELPNGISRSYSLLNDQTETHRYVVAVNRDPSSRGGSRFIHEGLRCGDRLQISEPANHFPLEESAAHTVLFAGGIGVTPLLCMARRLQALGRSWEMWYSARTRPVAACIDALMALDAEAGGNRVHLNFDQAPGGRMLDLQALVGACAPDTHVYCCGPLPMLAAFEAACAARDPSTVHVEYFTSATPVAAEGGYTVVLSRSGRSVEVAPGKTILDAMLDNDIDVPYSCMEGVCGTCELRVIEGLPDHRDLVLSKEERAANKSLMVCCSGSLTPRLVLDW
jgi:vanillate O-demethylase ferredoxin subunit